ncbi:MAG: N-acetylmuramoyl-L-alanine amidase [Terrimicrobiaceae bacterium]|nr:N-acetylmuramoyl-L-alanine amidase [Terrimicrobiaceae bacterium]
MRLKKLLRGFQGLLLAALCAGLAACAGMGGRYGPGAGFFNTVVVDAGHGGHDAGARAVSGSREKWLALDTAQRLADELRKRGFRVVETRRGDNFIPLSRRVEMSNSTPGSVFVSIHFNWARRRGASGIEIYYCSERSRRLAANILREALRGYPARNRGIKSARFYVLRNNRRPAVLCELGFLSNAHDNSYVQRPAVRQKLASRIAEGIAAERAGRIP